VKKDFRGKTWISSYLPIQELENFCFVAVDQRICELRSFVYIMSSTIEFSSLYMVKEGDTGKNLPYIRWPCSW